MANRNPSPETRFGSRRANAKGGLIHDKGAFDDPADIEQRMANAREVMVEITGKDRWIWGVTMRGAALRAFKSVFASALSQTADKAKRKRAAALPPRDRDSRRR